jgi:hypothetical protein
MCVRVYVCVYVYQYMYVCVCVRVYVCPHSYSLRHDPVGVRELINASGHFAASAEVAEAIHHLWPTSKKHVSDMFITHSLTHSLTHSVTQSLSHSLTQSLTHSVTIDSLTHSLIHTYLEEIGQFRCRHIQKELL